LGGECRHSNLNSLQDIAATSAASMIASESVGCLAHRAKTAEVIVGLRIVGPRLGAEPPPNGGRRRSVEIFRSLVAIIPFFVTRGCFGATETAISRHLP
jgi:hypothetical protein